MKLAKALGIIFANAHDANMPEITDKRSMASVPFAGRYRMIDFSLSAMVNAGIENVGVMVKNNYQSLMDHLGNGREWDLSRKIGGLKIFPPSFETRNRGMNTGRLNALEDILGYLGHQKEELVVMCDCDIACSANMGQIIQHHNASGADITMAYHKAQLRNGLLKENLVMEINPEGFVEKLRVNDYAKGVQNLSACTYVMRREFLIEIVKESVVQGRSSFERHFLLENLGRLKISSYQLTDYIARISDLQSYFEESMRLIENNNIQNLFIKGRPVYTKVRDNAPVRYAIGAQVKNSIVADGCVIHGQVENCVLFRGVYIAKGAKLANCVIMQGGTIGENAQLKYLVTDKNVSICSNKVLVGAKSFPVFISKGMHVD